MTQSLSEAVPRWSDLSLAKRRRLAVLIGRLALRQLPSSMTDPTPQMEAADEGICGSHSQPGNAR